ncbi:MAG: UDP-N-acetylmuramate--L-alanine ligase [Petrimonas sp.]|jgi:UDP-N-acetylmuramate--alanine ligase|uniref:UDP-N-acetylmuramate--L-alanine ligase n=1 Tax=Petrimonas TaxID=307628 RepID=UPI000E8C217F|nr:UDP-N-acetylmuramate--L-alanine ligase [Petrimonas sp.]NLU30384.1 UDP-N-acetylmuramate--L-alanine ligase [Bacteroidales bacterium]BBD44675.1 UDP-N-acetylmuramate--alanine ligase [Petrimonas sp. IBARAKI]HAC74293.1 UDP-N-acetylmuramate--L-alanine ligase [Porphyromonadaceae bacterium]MDD3543048.1 UDP-N-acetylmuramate--L-alanine ligase [Petrimonas sp.]
MNYELIYFIGIGGIGMSNLARYFIQQGKSVAGYDRMETPLTKALVAEGAKVHYEDYVRLVPAEFLDKEKTLVVYTPAVPASHSELQFFRQSGFTIMKRAQLLGEVTKTSDAVCVAGTHGKTTVSSMTAHLLRQSGVDCNAFLGGILKNYGTNLLLSDKSRITVAEADEYDRSFHWLQPWIAVITSADPDHLDIYGTPEAYRESFEHFTSLIRKNGYLILKKDAPLTPRTDATVTVFTYSESEGDFHAENIRIGNGEITFDFVSPNSRITGIQLGVPVKVNIENAVAAIAAAVLSGVNPDEVRAAMKTFGGAKRRFDFQLKTPNLVFIDDYAHHPQELTASIRSIRQLYPDRKVTGVFQPHLYTRTRDFADDFAQSLSLLDDVILLDIYPAREEPIPGITSGVIFDRITSKEKVLLKKAELLDFLENKELDVLVTLGAGDIEHLLPAIKQLLEKKSIGK